MTPDPSVPAVLPGILAVLAPKLADIVRAAVSLISADERAALREAMALGCAFRVWLGESRLIVAVELDGQAVPWLECPIAGLMPDVSEGAAN